MERSFPIVRHPAPGTRTPVLVSVPHYGTQPLPHITRDDYCEPWFETFAYGFADTFVGDLYADLDEQGATVLATPFSRMFVDVNRRRDDFEHADGEIRSRRGVVRTHTMRDAPIFTIAAEARYSSSELFIHYFHLARDDLKPQRIVGDNAVRLKLLAEQPDAIVYISVGEVERNAQSGAPIRPLPVAGVAATSPLMPTYPPPPVTFVRGEGSWLVDDAGKRYLDFLSGLAVTSLGHAHPAVAGALAPATYWFDQRVIDYLATEFKREQGIDLRNDKMALQRLKEAAEKAKMELSTSMETDVNLPFITADASGPKHLVTNLSRAKLEDLVADGRRHLLAGAHAAAAEAYYNVLWGRPLPQMRKLRGDFDPHRAWLAAGGRVDQGIEPNIPALAEAAHFAEDL